MESPQEKLIFDFTAPDAEWTAINDGVMGGVSSSRMILADGMGVFEGTCAGPQASPHICDSGNPRIDLF